MAPLNSGLVKVWFMALIGSLIAPNHRKHHRDRHNTAFVFASQHQTDVAVIYDVLTDISVMLLSVNKFLVLYAFLNVSLKQHYFKV